MIAESEWKWFGTAGHLCVGHDCRFHLATQIGDYLVSTVGQYLPDSSVRELLASHRGITLQGRGDDRERDWMRKVGYVEIGCNRKFESMVFKVTGRVCDNECGCGVPLIDPRECQFRGYNTAKEATEGHMAMCREVAAGEIWLKGENA